MEQAREEARLAICIILAPDGRPLGATDLIRADIVQGTDRMESESERDFDTALTASTKHCGSPHLKNSVLQCRVHFISSL
jgi:hypothetical protein